MFQESGRREKETRGVLEAAIRVRSNASASILHSWDCRVGGKGSRLRFGKPHSGPWKGPCKRPRTAWHLKGPDCWRGVKDNAPLALEEPRPQGCHPSVLLQLALSTHGEEMTSDTSVRQAHSSARPRRQLTGCVRSAFRADLSRPLPLPPRSIIPSFSPHTVTTAGLNVRRVRPAVREGRRLLNEYSRTAS